MSELVAVPGAQLYTEIQGAGPPLVFIVGGNGDATVFARVAAALATRFTVAVYDRRGFARSPLDGQVDDAARLATDVDDAVRMIAHLGRGPAHVFGSSSGAIVAIDLVARHPDRVRTVVAHEPPLATLLPDASAWLAVFDDVHATYVASGTAAAMAKFSAAVGLFAMQAPPADVQLPPAIAAMVARAAINQAFWLEHEVRQYPRAVPDVRALRTLAGQLVLAVGRDTRAPIIARPARVLAGSIQAPVVEFAGGHVGYVTDPVEFAARLGELLPAGPS